MSSRLQTPSVPEFVLILSLVSSVTFICVSVMLRRKRIQVTVKFSEFLR